MPDAPARGRLGFDADTVLAALEVAVRAPSIHNTQPWRWRLDGDGLTLLADRSRQLAVADPDGHSLLLSCGATLRLAELALQSAGWRIETTYLPESDGHGAGDPDVLAVVRPLGRVPEPAARLAAAVDAALCRRSDRRPFTAEPVSETERELLRAQASDDHAWIDFPDRPDRHTELVAAVSWADRVERNDEAYLAEMQHWLRDPQVHALLDGVPTGSIPHVPEDEARHSDVPLRDFEVGVTGGQLIQLDMDEKPLIVVVFTPADEPIDHLRAGATMMRLMLSAAMRGLASCPLSQAVDFAAFRARLRGRMGWVGSPQMMLRIGYPSAPVTALPRTPRRPPSAVLATSG